ncbi:aspartic proteinase CDR1-like [Apium graveolens]|uniref:aspartic proteinase CDR1-like n=1 Tax=Apium graveolens TaxID=4045 RepID=UPI003D7B7319
MWTEQSVMVILLQKDSCSGIVGLGGSHLLIISQLYETIQGKFSYCLVPVFRNETSTIIFVEKAQVSNSNKFSTPLFQVPRNPTYYLKLEKVLIGSESFKVPRKDEGGGSEDGHVVIDSGTTLTFLPTGTYYKFLSALKEAIGVNIRKDPTGFSDICYKTSSNVKMPVIGFQFKGVTLLKLPLSSTFPVVADDLTCLQVVPTTYTSIIGNLWQPNLLVSYDLHAKTVFFRKQIAAKSSAYTPLHLT